jgi:hypothetical protein
VRAELVTLRALLAVATAALALVPLRRPAVGALLVGAWLRLSTELPSLTTYEDDVGIGADQIVPLSNEYSNIDVPSTPDTTTLRHVGDGPQRALGG